MEISQKSCHLQSLRHSRSLIKSLEVSVLVALTRSASNAHLLQQLSRAVIGAVVCARNRTAECRGAGILPDRQLARKHHECFGRHHSPRIKRLKEGQLLAASWVSRIHCFSFCRIVSLVSRVRTIK